jgi:hypothetical protein
VKPSLTNNGISVHSLRRWIASDKYAAEIPRRVIDVCDNGRWRDRIDEQDHQRYTFEKFEDFVTAPLLGGLGLKSVEELEALCRGTRGDAAAAIEAIQKARTQQVGLDNPEPLKANSRPPKKRYTEEERNASSTISNRGNRASYRVRKLRRDHPAIASRLDAGEFRSVAAAERVARGQEAEPPRRKKSPLQQVKALWAKLTEAEKAEVRALL